MAAIDSEKIAKDPRFIELQRSRSHFSVVLTVAVAVIYYGFILVVAFFPQLLAMPVKEGMVMTVGLVAGCGVILSAIALTGIYVYRANRIYDPVMNTLIQEQRR